uniref:ABC transporter substrate-binding protein n=1 Tax=Hylemonella sp. TaxID=2066020 RepID=UPI0035B49463
MPAQSSRRRFLLAASTLPLLARPSRAQPLRPAPGRSPEIIQIVDSSPDQLDVSRDFLIGSRAAWQDYNARGGWRGRPVQHTVIETDGSAASLRQAWDTVRDSPLCLALCGTAGDHTAARLVELLRNDPLEIAHVAPWLHQDLPAGSESRTFPIYASRQEQIAHALRSLSVVGVPELGVVYASAPEQSLYETEVQRIVRTLPLQLRVQAYAPAGSLQELGRKLTPQTPPLLLFVGGTPELAQFTQGLDRQDRQRYVIGLADINLQTIKQLGAARNTAVMATQVVPMVTAGLPIVRSYRETLARLFDEPPTPQSLAGYIAARYAQDVLQTLEPWATRAQVLQAFQRRSQIDLAGFRIHFQAQRRSSAYVTQSMLTADGRIVG